MIKYFVSYPFKSLLIMMRILLTIPAIFLLFLSARAQQDTGIVVNDAIRPVAEVRSGTVYLNSRGFCSLVPEQFFDRSRPDQSKMGLSLDRTDLHCEDAGVQLLYITATDEAGISAFIPVRVTVLDTISPVVRTKNNSLILDNTGSVTPVAEMFDNGSFDACGIKEMRLTPDRFSCENLGENPVLLTVIDNNGNMASHQAEVTILDITAPTIKVLNLEAELDDFGNLTLNPGQVDNFSHDPCGLANFRLEPSRFDCENTGENLVTLTVTDKQGNSASREARVIISDNIPPEARVRDISLELDEQGRASLMVEDIEIGSTDNCGIRDFRLSRTEFTCDEAGETTVVLTVTDVNGNSSQAEAIVRIEDKTAPVVHLEEISLELDSEGVAVINPSQFRNMANDACGIEEINPEKTIFNCSDIGESQVKFSFSDNNGNSISEMVDIIIHDKIPPEAHAKNISLTLNNEGKAFLKASDVDDGSTDNCRVETMVVSQSEFTQEHLGDNEIILTVGDPAGNLSSAKVIVTVIQE